METETNEVPKNKPSPKKKPKTIRQQCQMDLEDFKTQMSEEMNNRFGRLEELLAGRQPPAPAQLPNVQSIPQDQLRHDQHQNLDQTNQPPLQEPLATASTSVSDNVSLYPATVVNAQPRTLITAPPLNAHAKDVTQDVASLTLNRNVNNNNPSTAWVLSQAINNPVPAPAIGSTTARPTSAGEFQYDDDMEARVNHILAATAHQFSAANGKPGFFPHKVVSRGPDRRRPAFNTLSLSEHVWGITRLIRDTKVPSNIKPFLYNHIEDIMEDSCQFDWASAIRPWSEEIFTRVAEERLTWDNRPEIQLLRMSIARNPAAKIGIVNDNPTKTNSGFDNNSRTRQAPSATFEYTKGGPPCDNYNSPTGCNLQSGHIIRGRRMIHVCKYCLYYTSAAHQHPETQCRNKVKFPPPNHF